MAAVLNYSPAFKQFGIQMVRFAKEEPKLFQVLYMQEHEEISEILSMEFQGILMLVKSGKYETVLSKRGR